MREEQLAQFPEFLDPNNYNGACLLGIDAVVVKSHGNASEAGYSEAIRKASKLAAGGFLQRAGDLFTGA